MYPEFSERGFEFCFNAEFIKKNSAILLGSPLVPSLRLEALRGYDVAFSISQGNKEKSLFFQHKISRFVTNRAGRNSSIYDFYDGAYYYFYLKNRNQQRLLYNLRQSGEQVYYSAPVFFRMGDLSNYFEQEKISNKTIFIDPLEIGLIKDNNTHKISYDQQGTRYLFQSEAKSIKGIFSFDNLKNEIISKKIDKEYFSHLFSVLRNGLEKTFEGRGGLPKRFSNLNDSAKCVYLLHKYYNVCLMVF